MKRPILPAFLVLLLLGLILWRETTAGFLVSTERNAAAWTFLAMDGKAPPNPEVVLILQGGITGEELSTLDVGLFTRAVARLEAAVGGIAAWEIPSAQIRLIPPRPSASPEPPALPVTRFIAGTILLPGPSLSGELPAPLWEDRPLSDTGLTSPNFSGAYSSFPPDLGWTTGFLNLSGTEKSADSSGGFLTLAGLSDVAVPSFALATVLASQSDLAHLENPTLGRFLLDGHVLPISATGELPLVAPLLSTLHRVDMDDLLLEAERREKNLPGDDSLRAILRGSIALLGTLAQDEKILTAPGSQRRLSLVEYQGLAIKSLLAALRPPSAPWWAGGIALLIFLPLATSLWFLRRSTACITAILLLCGVGLLGGALSAQLHLLLPMLVPTGLLFAAAILRLVLRRPQLPASQ